MESFRPLGEKVSAKMTIISIVDDDLGMGESISELLLAVGIPSNIFTSAKEFLESERIGDTSCLIADIKMPGIGGLELQKRVKASGYRFPVIFISAFDSATTRMAAEKAGAIGFLSKPFYENQLLECIRTALGLDFRST
jgi:FixJ family two-component response regulator